MTANSTYIDFSANWPKGQAPRGDAGSGVRGQARRFGHERPHDAGTRVDLRVPLDAERPPAVRDLDRLDEVVEHAPAARDHAVAEGVDALVMVRLGRVHDLTRGLAGHR